MGNLAGQMSRLPVHPCHIHPMLPTCAAIASKQQANNNENAFQPGLGACGASLSSNHRLVQGSEEKQTNTHALSINAGTQDPLPDTET